MYVCLDLIPFISDFPSRYSSLFNIVVICLVPQHLSIPSTRERSRLENRDSKDLQFRFSLYVIKIRRIKKLSFHMGKGRLLS